MLPNNVPPPSTSTWSTPSRAEQGERLVEVDAGPVGGRGDLLDLRAGRAPRVDGIGARVR